MKPTLPPVNQPGRRPGSSVRVLVILILPAVLALAATSNRHHTNRVAQVAEARQSNAFTLDRSAHLATPAVADSASRRTGPASLGYHRETRSGRGAVPTIAPADYWLIAGTPTPTATATPTPTPSPTDTATPTPSPTASPTATPLPTSDGVRRSRRVPVLMYHYISSPPPAADIYRRDLSVTPEQFEAQLRFFRERGYHTVSMRDLLYALNRGWPLPPKPLLLTFDDGYVDNYTNAFPLLRQYGFTATFFVLTAFADEQRAGYLTWQQIGTMSEAGMEIGSHSKDHPDLRRRGHDFLIWQILGSRQSVEAHIGQPVYAFSYPSGQSDTSVEQVLKEAGYLVAVGTQQGTEQDADHLLRLPRVRVRGDYTVDKLAEMIDYWMEK